MTHQTNHHRVKGNRLEPEGLLSKSPPAQVRPLAAHKMLTPALSFQTELTQNKSQHWFWIFSQDHLKLYPPAPQILNSLIFWWHIQALFTRSGDLFSPMTLNSMCIPIRGSLHCLLLSAPTLWTAWFHWLVKASPGDKGYSSKEK